MQKLLFLSDFFLENTVLLSWQFLIHWGMHPRRVAVWGCAQHTPTGLWNSAFHSATINFDSKFQCHLFPYLASGQKFPFPKEDRPWELQGALQCWAVTQEQEHNTQLLVRAMSPSSPHALPPSMEGKAAASEPHPYIWNPMDMAKECNAPLRASANDSKVQDTE